MQRIFSRITQIFAEDRGQARRVFHGRGQTFPGLEFVTLDWYPPLLFLMLYREPDRHWLVRLAAGLRERAGNRASTLLVQYRCRPGAPSEYLWGEPPAAPAAREKDLVFALQPGHAQNIGFFPDMAVGRALVRDIAADRRVLNLFAYTCGFSLAALAGGAREVVNLDMSRPALALGRQNHQLNGLDLRRARFLPHDLFKSFGTLQRNGPYHLVILDPPGPQGKSFQPRRDWPKILRRVPALLQPGGELLAVISSPDLGAGFLRELLDRELPGAELLRELGPGTDFPEADPDKGLNVFHLRLPA